MSFGAKVTLIFAMLTVLTSGIVAFLYITMVWAGTELPQNLPQVDHCKHIAELFG